MSIITADSFFVTADAINVTADGWMLDVLSWGTAGGIDKKKHKKFEEEKERREELEEIIKREFDILDGTYQPEVVEVVKQVIQPKIKQIDPTEYQIAIAQVNALLLEAKIKAAEYEAELDDEEVILMLL